MKAITTGHSTGQDTFSLDPVVHTKSSTYMDDVLCSDWNIKPDMIAEMRNILDKVMKSLCITTDLSIDSLVKRTRYLG